MAGTTKEQILVDATETDATARYAKRREFGRLVVDATRRADAMARLEMTLNLPARPVRPDRGLG